MDARKLLGLEEGQTVVVVAAKPKSTAWAIWPFVPPESMCGPSPRKQRPEDVSRTLRWGGIHSARAD